MRRRPGRRGRCVAGENGRTDRLWKTWTGTLALKTEKEMNDRGRKKEGRFRTFSWTLGIMALFLDVPPSKLEGKRRALLKYEPNVLLYEIMGTFMTWKVYVCMLECYRLLCISNCLHVFITKQENWGLIRACGPSRLLFSSNVTVFRPRPFLCAILFGCLLLLICCLLHVWHTLNPSWSPSEWIECPDS